MHRCEPAPRPRSVFERPRRWASTSTAKCGSARGEALDLRRGLLPSTSTLHGPVGQAQQLDDRGRACRSRKMSSGRGSFGGVATLCWASTTSWRSPFMASSSALIDFGRPDEERHDHVRKHDDVPQGQERDAPTFRLFFLGAQRGPPVVSSRRASSLSGRSRTRAAVNSFGTPSGRLPEVASGRLGLPLVDRAGAPRPARSLLRRRRIPRRRPATAGRT